MYGCWLCTSYCRQVEKTDIGRQGIEKKHLFDPIWVEVGQNKNKN
jgi:hypothetical protein